MPLGEGGRGGRDIKSPLHLKMGFIKMHAAHSTARISQWVLLLSDEPNALVKPLTECKPSKVFEPDLLVQPGGTQLFITALTGSQRLFKQERYP